MTTPEQRALLRRILVPTDFSPTADAALAIALKYAEAHDADLILLHVVWSTEHVLGTGAFVWTEQMKRDLDEAARLQLHTHAEALRASGVRCRAELAAGAPDQAIVQHAQDAAADLIVMGTHGRTGVARVMVGSIAERVVAHAPCPVLLVRTPA